MSQPTFEQVPLDLEKMNIILRALEWSYEDKNNPNGIRKKMKVLHGKLERHLHGILDRLD
jgi:hypothetical protein